MKALLPSGYQIQTGPGPMDWERIHRWLASTYWSPGIARARVERAAAHSSLVLGIFHAEAGQVGYGRVVSDRVRFAYLCDVYVEEIHRGRGLARAMVQHALDDPEFSTVKWVLATADAHRVYRELGFVPLPDPERWMARLPATC